jgi:hypothetical protein
MPNVIYAECRKQVFYALCRDAKVTGIGHRTFLLNDTETKPDNADKVKQLKMKQ